MYRLLCAITLAFFPAYQTCGETNFVTVTNPFSAQRGATVIRSVSTCGHVIALSRLQGIGREESASVEIRLVGPSHAMKPVGSFPLNVGFGKLIFSTDCRWLSASDQIIDVSNGLSKPVKSVEAGNKINIRGFRDGYFIGASEDSKLYRISAETGVVDLAVDLSEQLTKVFGIADYQNDEIVVLGTIYSKDHGYESKLRLLGVNLQTKQARLLYDGKDYALNWTGMGVASHKGKVYFSGHPYFQWSKQKIFILDGDTLREGPIGFDPIVVSSRGLLFSRIEGGYEAALYLSQDFSQRADKLQLLGQVGVQFDQAPLTLAGSVGGIIYAPFQSPLIYGGMVAYGAGSSEGRLIESGVDLSEGTASKRLDLSTRFGKLPGYLFLPKAKELKGVVVFAHGGNCQSSAMRSYIGFFWPLVKVFIEQGLAVYMAGYPYDASGELDGLAVLNINKNCEQIFRDRGAAILETVNQLREKLDTNNVILWGHSYGGAIVNDLAATWSKESPFSSVIGMAGVWTHDAYKPVRSEKLNKQFPKYLLLHGQDDENVPYSEAQRFMDSAKSIGIKFNAFTPAQGGHSLDSPIIWEELLNAVKQFVKEK